MKPTSFILLSIMTCLPLHALHAAQADESDGWDLSFSGSHRSRFSSLDNQFRPGLRGGDQALSMRTLGKLQADHGALTLVAEIQDSRNYLNDRGSALSTIEINSLEPLQLYTAYSWENALLNNDVLHLKAGRFTLDFGNGRLVARHAFRNTIQNYTGVQALWQADSGTSLSSFWVMPVKIKPADKQGLLDNDIQLDKADNSVQLMGVFYKTPFMLQEQILESYFFSLQENDKAGETETADRELYTAGVRLLKSPTVDNWDYEVEAAYQWGNRRATNQISDKQTLNVSANFLHGSLGYSVNTRWQPRLALSWTRASGDHQSDDTKYQRFDSLFGPRREYGPTGIYGLLGRNNLQSAALQLTLTANNKTDFMVSLRSNRLVSATDSFASSGVRDTSGLAGKDAGTQFEFRVRYWLQAQTLRLETGAALNQNGSFFDRAANATREGNPAFIYADLTFLF